MSVSTSTTMPLECLNHLADAQDPSPTDPHRSLSGRRPISLSSPGDRWTTRLVCALSLAGFCTWAVAAENPTPEFRIDLKRLELVGVTALTPEQTSVFTKPFEGRTATQTELRKLIEDIRSTYRQQGYPEAEVTLPRQVVVDGLLRIVVHEGAPIPSTIPSAPPSTAATNAPPVPPTAAQPPARTFAVQRYEVTGNTLLPEKTIQSLLEPGVGQQVTLAQIQKVLGALQLAYRERGFATVAVSLPQQQLTNAVVKVRVTEGVLTDIRVTGNRYFSSNNVLRALPSLRTNTQLNSLIFQRELDLANQNRDRQIFPTLGPGPDPGSSALNLRVKDRLPLHGRIELNNHSTPGTPDWRINSSLQYGNLWQQEHQLGLSYSFTPEQFKADGVVSDLLFNRPLISSYGLYYRMPFGSPESVQERIEQSGGRFGYNEATRQFVLPSPGSRPDLTFYASASSSDTGVKLSPASLVSQSPLLTIVSQDSGQNVSINENIGARLARPWALDDRRRVSVSAGLDLKRYLLQSYNTNNFFFTSVITNSTGSQTNQSSTASPQPGQSQEIFYLPLGIGADFSQSDAGGVFYAGLNLTWNVFGQSESISATTNRTTRDVSYGKGTLILSRDQKLYRDWTVFLRGSGQMATESLINNEQFAAGGVGSIRGYYEGDEYGDAGWTGSVELRTPYWATQAPTWNDPVPAWMRGFVFLDAGQRFLLDAPSGSKSTRFLLGTGLGLSANVNNVLDLRVIVGWPLRDSANSSFNDPRASFSLGGQF